MDNDIQLDVTITSFKYYRKSLPSLKSLKTYNRTAGLPEVLGPHAYSVSHTKFYLPLSHSWPNGLRCPHTMQRSIHSSFTNHQAFYCYRC